MKLGTLAGIVAGFASGLPIGQEEGSRAQDARTLVNREDIGTLSTVFQSGDLKGGPTGQMEYYADCYEDGSLTLVGMNISTAFTNINEGSKASLHVRQHPRHNKYKYPGGIPKSPAGSPRVTLMGTAEPLDNLSEEEQDRLSQCFLAVHPDAKWWLPGSEAVHDSYWVKFVPEKVHYIGGFGDRAFIGDIPTEEYQASAPKTKAKHQKKPKNREGEMSLKHQEDSPDREFHEFREENEGSEDGPEHRPLKHRKKKHHKGKKHDDDSDDEEEVKSFKHRKGKKHDDDSDEYLESLKHWIKEKVHGDDDDDFRGHRFEKRNRKLRIKGSFN